MKADDCSIKEHNQKSPHKLYAKVAPFTMGGSLSKALGKIFGNKEMRILMLGLDAAGKTSRQQINSSTTNRANIKLFSTN